MSKPYFIYNTNIYASSTAACAAVISVCLSASYKMSYNNVSAGDILLKIYNVYRFL